MECSWADYRPSWGLVYGKCYSLEYTNVEQLWHGFLCWFAGFLNSYLVRLGVHYGKMLEQLPVWHELACRNPDSGCFTMGCLTGDPTEVFTEQLQLWIDGEGKILWYMPRGCTKSIFVFFSLGRCFYVFLVGICPQILNVWYGVLTYIWVLLGVREFGYDTAQWVRCSFHIYILYTYMFDFDRGTVAYSIQMIPFVYLIYIETCTQQVHTCILYLDLHNNCSCFFLCKITKKFHQRQS